MEYLLVSIIVPVYKVELYLGKCIMSILGQSYKNLEIILVDDGSPDACPQICDEWAAQDERVVVIHKDNGGLSDARNAGLSIATGDLVCFVDSDDWIEKDTIKFAVDRMIEKDADVAVWSYFVDEVDSDEMIINQSKVSFDAYCQRGEGYDNIIRAGGLALYAWNKLYRADLLKENHFRFEKGVSLVEDVLFNSQVLPAAKSVVFLAETGTHYIQRKRITLGNAYYPNAFQLLLRSSEANGMLFRAFGAPEPVITEWQTKFCFSSLLQSCRGICHTSKLNYHEKHMKLKKLMSRDTAKQVIVNYKPCKDLHNKVYKFLLQWKLISLFLLLERMRDR